MKHRTPSQSTALSRRALLAAGASAAALAGFPAIVRAQARELVV
jgi:hypothetical protein